jgi:hypothetical protein
VRAHRCVCLIEECNRTTAIPFINPISPKIALLQTLVSNYAAFGGEPHCRLIHRRITIIPLYRLPPARHYI